MPSTGTWSGEQRKKIGLACDRLLVKDIVLAEEQAELDTRIF